MAAENLALVEAAEAYHAGYEIWYQNCYHIIRMSKSSYQ